MKIKQAKINNHKKCLVAVTSQQDFELPFSRLRLCPSPEDRVEEIFVDSEMGNEAITYRLSSGREDTIHLDVFLDYNRDPDYLRRIFLFELTRKAQKAMESSDLSKNEICRRLKTSPSQLARLLDQTNEKKSVDKMLELLAVLGVTVKPSFVA